MKTTQLFGLSAFATLATATNNTTYAAPEGLTNWGVVLYPAYDNLDVAGPTHALFPLTSNYTMNLYFLSSTMDPVSSRSVSAGMNPSGSYFNHSRVPTHTFDNAPDLDVLLIPGGGGARAPNSTLLPAMNFLKERYPKVKYIFTTCTGSAILAKTGILDGHRATTNKRAWTWATSQGPNVKWVTHARWVEDGKIWTTSGVAAGIDGMFAFIRAKFGNLVGDTAADMIEYVPWRNASYDPFADMYNLPRNE